MRIAFFLFSLLLGGCAVPVERAQHAAESYRQAIIGKSTSDLMRCAGAPITAIEHPKSWVYHVREEKVGNYGVESECTATVELIDDRVSHVTYRSTRTFMPLSTCEPIFKGCTG